MKKFTSVGILLTALVAKDFGYCFCYNAATFGSGLVGIVSPSPYPVYE